MSADLEKEARRYRWLRAQTTNDPNEALVFPFVSSICVSGPTGPETNADRLDAAIDMAMGDGVLS